MMRSLFLATLAYSGLAQTTSSTGSILEIVKPASLRSMFTDMGGTVNGRVSNNPALFGNPMGGGENSIQGTLVYPPGQEDTACSTLNKTTLANVTGYMILLLDRGSCYFYQKVQHAQDAGAHAAIIVDNVDEPGIPFMADVNDLGAQISIPSVLIHKSDGQKIKDKLAINPDVFVKLAWNLPNPDNTVEWDFWTSSDPSSTAVTFLQNFQEAAKVLGEAAMISPRYFTTYLPSCGTSPDFCEKTCTNSGRYCSSSSGAHEGSDVVREDLRQMCIFKTLNNTNYAATDKWWTYVNNFNKECSVDFTKACSEKMMTKSGIDVKTVSDCVTACGGSETTGGVNSCFEAEQTFQNDRGIWSPYTVTINRMPYRGSIYCPAPITKPTCGVLSMICLGFANATTIDACTTARDCPLGQKLNECRDCSGDPEARQKDKCGVCKVLNSPNFDKCASDTPVDTSIKFPTWGVVLIVLGCVLVVAFGVYYFMRRREEAMREDIDKLLAQYINLGDAGQSA